MSEHLAEQQPIAMPENELLNALISAGVRGEVSVSDVANELIRSVIYVGSTEGDIETMSDMEPVFLKIGTSD